MTGFGKDPVNPFTNSVDRQRPMYSANRQPPCIRVQRRPALPRSQQPGESHWESERGHRPGIPGYYDTLGNSPPTAASTTLNFYVYFSGYGNGVYDANDVNFLTEADGNLERGRSG